MSFTTKVREANASLQGLEVFEYLDAAPVRDPLVVLGAFNDGGLSQSLGARLSRQQRQQQQQMQQQQLAGLEESETSGIVKTEQAGLDSEALPFLLTEDEDVPELTNMHGILNQTMHRDQRGSIDESFSSSNSPTEGAAEDGTSSTAKRRNSEMERRRERNRAAQKAFRDRRDKREADLQAEVEDLRLQLDRIRTNMELLRTHRPGLYQHLQISLGNILRETRRQDNLENLAAEEMMLDQT